MKNSEILLLFWSNIDIPQNFLKIDIETDPSSLITHLSFSIPHIEVRNAITNDMPADIVNYVGKNGRRKLYKFLIDNIEKDPEGKDLLIRWAQKNLIGWNPLHNLP